MISKTIGCNGVHNIFRQTHMEDVTCLFWPETYGSHEDHQAQNGGNYEQLRCSPSNMGTIFPTKMKWHGIEWFDRSWRDVEEPWWSCCKTHRFEPFNHQNKTIQNLEFHQPRQIFHDQQVGLHHYSPWRTTGIARWDAPKKPSNSAEKKCAGTSKEAAGNEARNAKLVSEPIAVWWYHTFMLFPCLAWRYQLFSFSIISICLSFYLSIFLSIFLSFYLSIYLPIYLPTYLSFYRFI